MKKLFILFTVCTLLAEGAMAWGQKGHDVIANIAERNLTPKAKKALAEVLGGRSMVYDSSFPDQVKKMPGYEGTATWHYVNVDDGYTYETMPREPKGDVYTAISFMTEQLKDRNLDDSVRNTYTVMLIHLVGDLHCPMHAGRRSDRGGNDYKITWFRQPTNLHSIWDSRVIEAAHNWSYSEWAEQLDRCDKQTKREIMSGTPLDWLHETVDISKLIYRNTPEGSDCGYDYVFEHSKLVEQQLLKGGYRLAALLNEIYR